MTRTEFSNSMGRILGLYSNLTRDAARLEAYATSIYESVRDLTAEIFEEATLRVLKTADPIKPPMPRAFLAAAEVVKAARRVNAPAPERRVTKEESKAWCLEESRRLSPTAAKKIMKSLQEAGVRLDAEHFEVLKKIAGEDKEEESEVPF